MNWAEAIVLIVIASGLAKVVSAAIQSGKHSHSVTFQPDERTASDLREALAQNASLRRDVNDLRERIRVLERIATADAKSRDLADEIERLR
jgi:flagellar motility protein MotE (MotC chaperone)